MQPRIRTFETSDYAAYIELYNAIHPDHPSSEEELRHRDAHREAKLVRGRFVCERDGCLIGYLAYTTMSWMYHPRKFYCNLGVAQEQRGRGIGTALYKRLLAELAPHDPLSVRCEVMEDRPETIRFAETRGFAAGMREQASALDLARLNPADYVEDLDRVEDEGIVIVSYDDLEEDPDRHRKIYDLDMAASRDMPMPEPFTLPPFDNYEASYFNRPTLSGRTFMIALDDDAYVGMSALWTCPEKTRLETGFTGVLGEYRGRGIATALKVRALTAAKQLGYEEVRTSNDSTNASMLGINWRLGFEKQPAWIDYEKVFTDAAADGEHEEDAQCGA